MRPVCNDLRKDCARLITTALAKEGQRISSLPVQSSATWRPRHMRHSCICKKRLSNTRVLPARKTSSSGVSRHSRAGNSRVGRSFYLANAHLARLTLNFSIETNLHGCSLQTSRIILCKERQCNSQNDRHNSGLIATVCIHLSARACSILPKRGLHLDNAQTTSGKVPQAGVRKAMVSVQVWTIAAEQTLGAPIRRSASVPDSILHHGGNSHDRIRHRDRCQLSRRIGWG